MKILICTKLTFSIMPVHATMNWRLKSGKKNENFNLHKVDFQHNASACSNGLETEVR